MASRKQAAAETAEPVPRSSRRVIKSKFSSGEWVTDEIVPSKKESNSTTGGRGKKVAKIVTVEVPPEPEPDGEEKSNEKSAVNEKVKNEKVTPKTETQEVEKAPSSPPKPQAEKRPLSPSKAGPLSKKLEIGKIATIIQGSVTRKSDDTIKATTIKATSIATKANSVHWRW